MLCLLLAVLLLGQSSARLLQASSSSSSTDSIPSEWITGIAINYGGPSEGKDPGSYSWGTIEVSLMLLSNNNIYRPVHNQCDSGAPHQYAYGTQDCHSAQHGHCESISPSAA